MKVYPCSFNIPIKTMFGLQVGKETNLDWLKIRTHACALLSISNYLNKAMIIRKRKLIQ